MKSVVAALAVLLSGHAFGCSLDTLSDKDYPVTLAQLPTACSAMGDTEGQTNIYAKYINGYTMRHLHKNISTCNEYVYLARSVHLRTIPCIIDPLHTASPTWRLPGSTTTRPWPTRSGSVTRARSRSAGTWAPAAPWWDRTA